jgi:biopolymer transport protein ExbD
VVLVLLIIFMVVTPLLEKDIAVSVATQQIEQPREVPRDQIVVEVKRDGDFVINAVPVAGARYAQHLKQALANKAAQDRIVFFSADGDASYAKLVHALDGAKAAGANVLGLTPETLVKAAPAP